ncbi:MAG: transglycosylase domain-containing protein [Anaerorhabdus sp.]
MRRFFKKLFIIFTFICLGLAFTVFYTGFSTYKSVTNSESIEDKVNELKMIEGYTNYNNIDDLFLKAVVATEDRRFYKRQGIDIISIIRAFFTNVKESEVVEGGSTITQQVAKNMYFSNAPSFKRKCAEIFLTRDLERMYTKDEILEMYVNINYYGDGFYGIHSASMGYFDKFPNELDLYEATILAGLPQSPSIYQLSNGYDKIYERQEVVLRAMVNEKIISKTQMDDVINSRSKRRNNERNN